MYSYTYTHTYITHSLVDYFSSGSSNLTALRSIRILRPLRTVTRVKGLRRLVVTFLHALPLLMNTVALCGFFYLIFGLIGVQLFAGKLRFRCMDVDTGKCMYACLCMYVCMYIYLCICMHMRKYACMCMHTCVYIRIYVHLHVHKYTHAQASSMKP